MALLTPKTEQTNNEMLISRSNECVVIYRVIDPSAGSLRLSLGPFISILIRFIFIIFRVLFKMVLSDPSTAIMTGPGTPPRGRSPYKLRHIRYLDLLACRYFLFDLRPKMGPKSGSISSGGGPSSDHLKPSWGYVGYLDAIMRVS